MAAGFKDPAYQICNLFALFSQFLAPYKYFFYYIGHFLQKFEFLL